MIGRDFVVAGLLIVFVYAVLVATSFVAGLLR